MAVVAGVVFFAVRALLALISINGRETSFGVGCASAPLGGRTWCRPRPEAKMILSSHAIVGGAIASLFPSHPILVVLAGFASHFAIDAIPHWDYPLRSISVGKGADNRRLKIDASLLRDLAFIGADASAGLALAVLLFATPATAWVIALGAIAGMLPDPLQFVHSIYPREPLRSLQRSHQWIHTKRNLAWRLGVSSQAAFVAAVSAIVLL
jgi:hypothetical protein